MANDIFIPDIHRNRSFRLKDLKYWSRNNRDMFFFAFLRRLKMYQGKIRVSKALWKLRDAHLNESYHILTCKSDSKRPTSCLSDTLL